MWLMLQQDEPEDFVVATGKTTAVRDVVRMAFSELGIQLEFRGEGVEERGVVAGCEGGELALPSGREVVAVDPAYFRPTEVDLLIGDPRKAKERLGWEPKRELDGLIREMVRADLDRVRQEQLLAEAGYPVRPPSE
jgi:GDPmannose 4,6-dehydratase